MRGQEIGLARNARAAIVGDQRDMMAAPLQLCGKRKGGNQMAAGSSGSEHEMARDSHGARRSFGSNVSRDR